MAAAVGVGVVSRRCFVPRGLGTFDDKPRVNYALVDLTEQVATEFVPT